MTTYEEPPRGMEPPGAGPHQMEGHGDMPTITPDPPDRARRIALTAAAHTLADIYREEELPLLRWHVDQYAILSAYVDTRGELATYAKWLDVDIDTDIQPGWSLHTARGWKAGIEIRVIYIAEPTPPAGSLALVAGQ